MYQGCGWNDEEMMENYAEEYYENPEELFD